MRLRPRCVRSLVAVHTLMALLCGAPRRATAKETWIEIRSPHFTVIGNTGEKEARGIAGQFEQFREVFHTSFKDLRLDLGCPLIIFALKNEDSLKAFLPGYWETKGRAHPAGIYVSGEERHFVALRTNTEGPNPYEVVYHEYAHAILGLNFRNMPVWLSEGLAEYFGNTRIAGEEVYIGVRSPTRLQTLRESRLIPMEELLSADQSSPYYNERERVSVFYAESWAIVHYLLLDPEARKQQLLANFLKEWDASGDQVEAARKAFGDLAKFSQKMEAYARNRDFMVSVVKTSAHDDPKSFPARAIPPAELAAYRALFYIHTRRPAEAEAAANEAVQQDPQLSLAYEAQGLLAYTQNRYESAAKAFSKAAELPGVTFSAYYFEAASLLRGGFASEATDRQIVAGLEKAIELNPLFAPAYASLGSIDSVRPGTATQAAQAARKAVELDPGNLQYALSLAHVLLNTGRIAEAKTLAVRIRQAARTPKDKAGAEQLLQSVAAFEEQSEQAAANARPAQERNAPTTATAPPTAPAVSAPSAKDVNKDTAAPPKGKRTQYMAEGVIADSECNQDSMGRVTLLVDHSRMRFLYSSLAKLNVVEGLTEDSGNAPACPDWKGRRARLFFYQTKDKPYAGELQTVQFF